MNEKQREFVYFALSFIPLYIYHGQEERKTRKEGGQTHEQEATVRPADGLPARERQRKRVAEKDIPTTAPHHPSAEKAVHGPAGRTERGRLHHRDGAPRLPLAPTRRGDDRTVRAQKQRQELLHPRRRRRPHLHRRTQLRPRHEQRPRAHSLLRPPPGKNSRRRGAGNTGARRRQHRGHPGGDAQLCLPADRKPHAGQRHLHPQG